MDNETILVKIGSVVWVILCGSHQYPTMTINNVVTLGQDVRNEEAKVIGCVYVLCARKRAFISCFCLLVPFLVPIFVEYHE